MMVAKSAMPPNRMKKPVMTRRLDFSILTSSLKAQFSQLVRKAVSALDQPRRPRRPGSAKGRVWVASDFDKTPRDFKDYV